MKKILLVFFGMILIGVGFYYTKPQWEGIFFLKTMGARDQLNQGLTSDFTYEPTVLSHIITPLPEISKTKGIFNPQTVKLKNGLQVVVITNRRSPVVQQMVFYKVGSVDDPRGKSGIAHFLEHLMFNGKSKYAAPKQFDKIIKRLGGIHNAFTTFDMTAYYEQCPKEALEQVIKLEAGRMEELHLTNDIVKPERDVILEERSMRLDNVPEQTLFEAVMRALYQNSGMGRHPLGWRNEMEGLTLEDAQDFHYHWYCPNNAIVVFMGDVTLEEVKPLVEKYYGSIAARPIKKRTLLIEPVFRGVDMRLVKKSDRVKQPMLERLYKISTLSYGNACDVFPLRVLTYILSNGQNSLLYKHFVTEKKMATAADFSALDTVVAPGFASFSLLPAPDIDMKDLETELESFLEDLIKKGISDKLVDEAKQRMLSTFKYANDNVFSGGQAIGSALVRGRSIDEVEFMPDYLEAVTPSQVNKVMKDLFERKDYLIALLLPEDKKMSSEEEKNKEKGINSPQKPMGISIAKTKSSGKDAPQKEQS